MAASRATKLDYMKEELANYLGASLADFYCLPAHRLMIYAVTFILMGLGVFSALAVYDHSNDLVAIPLSFMGMNAWHTAANFACATILVDLLVAYLIRPWGAYQERTVGKVWVIFFGAFLLGFLSERTFAYKLITLYEPGLVWLWESYPSQRAGAMSMFLFTLPFWLVITAVVMRIITSKQAQTEELLRVRIDTILEERTLLHDVCPELAAMAKAHVSMSPNDLLQLPTDPGVPPIRMADIEHVTSEDHYLRIYFQGEGHLLNTLVRMSLTELTQRLPGDHFARIHRSHLVNLEQISGLKRVGRTVRLSMKHGDFELPVSRYRLPQLLPMLEQYLTP